MKFTVEKEENIINVMIELPRLVQDRETGLDINRIVLREKQVRDYLRKENINAGECINKDNLDNMGSRLEARWSFANLNQKTLDKTPVSVVKFNNEVVSKPKPRRRKTTSKKKG